MKFYTYFMPLCITTIFLFISIIGLEAQEMVAPTIDASPAPKTKTVISKGFDTIKLGMAYQSVYDALRENSSFDYRGTPDVSLSPGRDEKIIETRGGTYISRATFQFRNEKLFTIILELNPAQLDYYGLYTTFLSKYGEPANLNPKETMWEDGLTRLILEKPLILKYIDILVLDEVRKKAGIRESFQEMSRAQFIDKL